MSLLELIRHKKEMRRIFGQQELKIIEKQLLGVNLSPSERTRLSRDIRSKFNIILALSDFKNEFPLKKAQEIKFLIEESKEIILESTYHNKIDKIFVFGSYTQNNLRLNSDIDIAIEFNKISKKEATKFRIEIQSKVSERIQVQVFNILPPKIKNEILKSSKIIYNNEQS